MFAVRLHHGEFDEVTLADSLQVLVDHNVRLLRRRTLPYLYASGVRYEREPVGVEDWYPADVVAERGRGDCEDLACWRAAELIVYGLQALGPQEADARRHLETHHLRGADGVLHSAQAVLRAVGGMQYHVIVRFNLGPISMEDDPSVRLGMRVPSHRLVAPRDRRTAVPALTSRPERIA